MWNFQIYSVFIHCCWHVGLWLKIRKMYEAVFQILRENKSLELTITSYQLLLDLEKVYSFWTSCLYYLFSEDYLQALCLSVAWMAFWLQRFPPVTVAKMAGSSSDAMEAELVINSEAWNCLLLLIYVVHLSIVTCCMTKKGQQTEHNVVLKWG